MPRWSLGRMQPPLRARSFLFDRRCRSLSASVRRLVQHSVPLQFSMIARPHEVGLVDSWRADSQSRSVARTRNYPMCENSGSGRRRTAKTQRIPWTFLYHPPELVQRAQIIRPWLVSDSLRPVGPRHLADIEVAVAVHRKPMRRQELGWTKARAKPA